MNQNQKLAPGMVLGRYELLLPIAQGGMATVWAARQKGSRGFQKIVAVKTMLPGLSDDPQFEQMFLDEAALASRIHHPNVAEILDLGEQDEVLYLVMEWVDGEALSVVTKAARRDHTYLPQRIALRIVGQACAGLHAAHELKNDEDQSIGLVHRDVSPQNILVTYDGIVKLVDFGVAKATGRAGGETTAGQLKGKIPYMSPEQARGGQVDRRTDIFAMGIVLYRLTTGTHPFLGDNDLVTMRNIISRPAMSPRIKNPNFSPELEQLLMTCLEKDPAKRFQTMVDLDRAIDRVLASTGVYVVDDDVGAFVRGLLGDRGNKRRSALRDAIRAADERAAGINPAATPEPLAVVHEGVTDLLITKMETGLADDLPPSSLRNAPVEPRTSSQSLSAMAAEDDPPSQLRPRRLGMLVSGGALVAAALVVAAIAVRANRGPEPQASPAAVQPDPRLTQRSGGSPTPTATAAVVATETESATPAVDVADLPVAGDKPATKKVGAHEVPSATPSGDAPSNYPKAWSPTVQNPGF
jgi:serine/threonine-protein kinase